MNLKKCFKKSLLLIIFISLCGIALSAPEGYITKLHYNDCDGGAVSEDVGECLVSCVVSCDTLDKGKIVAEQFVKAGTEDGYGNEGWMDSWVDLYFPDGKKLTVNTKNNKDHFNFENFNSGDYSGSYKNLLVGVNIKLQQNELIVETANKFSGACPGTFLNWYASYDTGNLDHYCYCASHQNNEKLEDISYYGSCDT